MINCITKKGSHRIISCSLFFWLCIAVAMLVISAPAFCYELNGTATGNLLSSGYAAQTDDFSASADVENSYALVIEKDGKTFTADGDNAQYLNICGDKVYYTTIDGIAKETILRCYDVSSDTITDLYAVPIGEGMKNLFVINDTAYFQSNGYIKSYCLDTGSVATVAGSGEIAAFVPVSNFLLYTTYDGDDLPLYAYDMSAETTAALADQVTTFDVYGNDVYYSDGENGLYRVSLNGGSAEQLAKGTVQQIVCTDDTVYWQGLADDTVTSLTYDDEDKDTQKVDDYTSFSVLDNGIETVEEAIGEGGSGSTTSSVSTSSLPTGTYKSWKQWDSRWSSVAMGSTTVGRAGCLVTSLAILLVGSGAEKERYLAGTFDPGEFAKMLNNNGGFDASGNLQWGAIPVLEPTFSSITDSGKGTTTFSSSTNDQKASTIANYISAGRYVTICVDNPSTGSTHWLAADYVSGSTVYECDPGYSSKTGVLFTDYPSVTRLVTFYYSGTPWSGGDPTSVVWDNPFSDVSSSSWYYDVVGQVYTRNLFSGTSTTTFSPNDKTTRAMFVTVLGRLSGADLDQFEYDFNDVCLTSYYAPSVSWAACKSIVNGYDNGSFCPDQNITREQACVIMVRFAEYMGIDLTATQAAGTFSDSSSISSWAKDAVVTAQRAGLINGKGNNLFDPQGYATRAEVAAIMIRLLNKM